MKTPHRLRSLLALAFAVLCAAPALTHAATYTNPVISSFGAMADPAFIRANGYFYVFPTGDNTSFRAYRSTNLVSWQDMGTAYSTGVQNTWAPDVFYWPADNKYYLWGSSGAGATAFVTSQTNPENVFTFENNFGNSPGIDHDAFIDDNGDLWRYGAIGSVEKMNSPTSATGNRINILELYTQPRSSISNEGPEVIKHNGKYYYFYSAGAATGTTYNFNVAIGDAPDGPFVNFEGNPILQTQGYKNLWGPGHAAFAKDSLGEWWLAYQQYQTLTISWDRRIAVDRVWFDENGIPHVNATRGTPETAANEAFPTRTATTQIEAEKFNGKSGGYEGTNAQSFNNFTGVQAGAASEGGACVVYKPDTDYTLHFASYRKLNFGTGVNALQLRVASSVTSGQPAGEILVRAGGVYGPIVGIAQINGTGSDSTWTTISCPVGTLAGLRDIVLEFQGTGTFRINWFTFVSGTPAAHAPVAADDLTETIVNTPVTFDPTVNDIDFNTDIAAVTAVSTPGHGTAQFSGTTVTYTPATGFVGTDSFTYTVRDAQNATSSATVTVEVTHPGSDLYVEAEALAGTQDGIIIDDPLASGGRAFQSTETSWGGRGRERWITYPFEAKSSGYYKVHIRAKASSTSKDELWAGIYSADGALTPNANAYGSFAMLDNIPTSYDWRRVDSNYYSPAREVEWYLTKGHHVLNIVPGYEDLVIDQIRIEPPAAGAGPVDFPPQFSAPAFGTKVARAGTFYSVSVAGEVSDPDATSLTYSKVSGPAWASVSPSGNLFGTPAAGDAGLNTVRVRVTDDDNQSAEADVVLSVYGAAQALDVTDGFESGDFSGGLGWKDPQWFTEARWNGYNRPVVTGDQWWSNPPTEGTLFAAVQTISWMSRTVDLSDATNPVLSFDWSVDRLDKNSYVALQVFDGEWHEIFKYRYSDLGSTWPSPWATVSVPLSGYNLNANFKIRFELFSDVTTDRHFIIDDIRITNAVQPPVVSSGGSLDLTASTLSLPEGNSGTSNASLSVSRSGGSSGAVSVDYATANGTAVSGSDYTATSGTLTWADGDTADKAITIPILGDTTFESDETFTVTLSNPTGSSSLGTTTAATVTITNDDAGPGTLALTADNATVDETAISATFTVARTGGDAGSVSVAYTTADGTATAGSDYVATSGTLSWADGDSADKAITIPILNDGTLDPAETFTLSLSTPTGGAVLGTTTTTITLTDDEIVPMIETSLLTLGFTGGNGSASIDQYTGTTGSGWSSAWSTSTSTLINSSQSVVNTTPVVSGGGNYLSLTSAFNGSTPGSPGRTATAARRAYDGIDLTAETTYSFDVRIDSLTSFDNASGDVISFFNSTSATQTFLNQADSTWGIRLNGASGSNNLTVSYASANNAVTTLAGATLAVGKTYRFTISSDPATETWGFNIHNVTDDIAVGSAVTGAGWFGSTAIANTHGNQIVFGTALNRAANVANNPADGSAVWSLDNLAATSVVINTSATVPAITTPPASQTVNTGATATFTVSATGSSLAYTWKRGGTPVGTDSATLSLSNVQPADAGDYTVTIANEAGSVTSHPAATLTVNSATPLETWTASIDWQGADSSPTAIVSPLGVTNLMLYALDIDSPFSSDTSKLPSLSTDDLTPGGPWLTFTYRENQSATDLTYTVRSSTNLTTWSDVTVDNITIFEDIADANPDGDNSSALIRVRIPHDPTTTPKQFLRLQVTQ